MQNHCVLGSIKYMDLLIHNGIRYLVLFDYGWFNKTCDTIKYLISEKGDITDSINHNFVIYINSVVNKKITTTKYSFRKSFV